MLFKASVVILALAASTEAISVRGIEDSFLFRRAAFPQQNGGQNRGGNNNGGGNANGGNANAGGAGAGAGGGGAAAGGATCLNANSIATGSLDNGQDPPVAGQSNSATYVDSQPNPNQYTNECPATLPTSSTSVLAKPSPTVSRPPVAHVTQSVCLPTPSSHESSANRIQ